MSLKQSSRLAYLASIIFLSAGVGCAKKPNISHGSKSIAQQNSDLDNCIAQAKVKLEGAVGAAERDARAAYAASSVSSATSSITSASTSVGGVNLSGSANRGVNNWMKDFFTDRSDDPAFRREVNRCLRKKGYRVGDWE